ncbi:unnamed protein product [Heligmosomoides polygyrus]|uniref:DUF5641 domain-containing protein n=1 Tax=Heligmosomoides polygyrus TaxID=6339 RepID=A0A183G6U7_HELPZ|nr:unnamed protein product [Heligmosomoides polygyrus]
MSTASSNNDILSEAMQALADNVSAPQTPANEDNAARDSQVQAQAPPQPLMQLDKLPLESFSGDITQFHSFWSAFELAIHNNSSIPPVYKFLYLRGLLKGDARIVLQDLDPDECNYADLVQALKRRYDRPHRTRARFHMQLKQLPKSGLAGSELRETWFRISGLLHGLRKFEDFKMVLPILDLVKGKFPQEIQTKLHDFEGEDFDLDAVMCHLDNIIASKEKYEDSTMLNEDYAVHVNTPQRGRTRTPSPRRHDTNICHFCDSADHETSQYHVKIPVFARHHADTVDTYTTSSCVKSAGAEDRIRVTAPDRERIATVVFIVIDRHPGIAIPPEAHPGAEDAPGVRHTIDIIVHSRTTDTNTDRIGEKDRIRHEDGIDLHPLTSHSSPPGDKATTIALGDHFRVHHRSTCLGNGSRVRTASTDVSGTQITKRTLFRLPVADRRQRTFVAFGGQRVSEISGVTQLSLVDLFDEKLTLTLTTKDVITLSQRPPHLSSADVEFIRRQGHDMPLCHSCGPVFPDILVGIDAYWDVVTSDPPVELPSGMFLTHSRLIDFISPEVNIQLPPVSQLSDQYQDVSYRLVDWYKETVKVLDSFWDIWHRDYLAALRERQQLPTRRKRSTTKTPKEGDIVLMADDKLPRGQWPLGVLMKICYGQDNVARSATVRTSSGRQLIRSLAHLYPLEISAPDVSSGPDSSSTPPPKRVMRFTATRLPSHHYASYRRPEQHRPADSPTRRYVLNIIRHAFQVIAHRPNQPLEARDAAVDYYQGEDPSWSASDDITPAPSTSQLHSDSDDALPSQFVRILQRNPAADIPLIKQLTDELSQLAAVKEQPEVEVPLNAVTMRKREPTVAERLLALVRRRDPKQYFSRADDLELQLAAVPDHDRPLLALLQKLTVALNPDHIFDLKHLGAHDYVQVDAYLRSDLHRSLRSYITKEVYLPEWSDEEKSRYPQCAVLLVVQNVKGIKAQCHSLQEFLAQLANAPTLNFGSSLFENIMTIQSLVYNITARQAAVHNQFWSQAFRKDDQPRLADQLAQYGLHFSDIHDALALATATVAEAQQVLANLSQQHLERLLIIQDNEIFAATEQAPPQTRSSGAGAKRQSQSPTFSEEIDKLARTADLRPTLEEF